MEKFSSHLFFNCSCIVAELHQFFECKERHKVFKGSFGDYQLMLWRSLDIDIM